jgi:hypothetical protein
VIRRLSGAAREAWLALGASIFVAAVMTWPTLRHPGSSVPQDTGDPLLQAWQIAWGGHALVHQPGHLFDTNTFYPLKDTLAFSDSLLGYAPFGLIGSGPTAALVRYNLLFVAAWALSSWGAYLLARQLGARRAGAAVAGAVFAYAPWRLSQSGHLNVLSTGPMLVGLALLARGHGYRMGGHRSPRFGFARPGVALLGWAVAAWQVTLGFGLGLAFLMIIGLVAAVAIAWWISAGRPPVPRRLAVADLAGMVLLLTVAGTFAVIYIHAVAAYPEARRQIGDVEIFSPPWRGLLTTPSTDLLWGSHQNGLRSKLTWPPEMTLAPGLAAVVLAVLGAFVGRWSRRRRLVLAGTAVTVTLFALGTSLAGGRYTYRLLYDDVPGWQGVRTPSRLIVWTLAALCLLAAAGTDRLVEWVAPLVRQSRHRTAPVVGTIVASLVALEGVGTTPHPTVDPPPPAFHLAAARGYPLLVLPSDEVSDERVMWWSTDGFPRIANGGSGVTPRLTTQVRAFGAEFVGVGARPDVRAALTSVGVRTVVVRLDEIGPAAAEQLLTTTVPSGVTRQVVRGDGDGDAVFSW